MKINLSKTIEYLLYLTVLALTLQTRWIIQVGFNEYSTYGLYAIDILTLVLIILNLVKHFVTHKSDPEGGFKITMIWWLIAGLDLFIFVSIFFASDKWLALYRYAWFLLGVGLFWVIGAAIYDRTKLLYSFLIGLSFQAIIGIYQFITQTSFATKWLGIAIHNPGDLGVSVIEVVGGRWLRAYGGVDHPNILGGLMVVGILLVANRVSRIAHLKKWSIIDYIIYSILVTCLFFTFSRSAWLALICAFLFSGFFAILKKDREALKVLAKFIVVGTALIAVLAFIYKDLVFTRLSGEGRLEVRSTNERLASVNEAWQIIKAHPFFGVGAGNYTLALRELKPNESVYYYQPVHNTFLLIWAEIGIFGLLFFIAILLYAVSYSLHDKNYLALGLIFAMIVMMMFDHWWWSLHEGTLFLFLIINFYSIKYDI